MKYILISILIVIHLCFNHAQMAYGPESTYQHFVYMFAHGNVFHLAGNALVLWLLLKNRTIPTQARLLMGGYAVAVVCSYIAYSTHPTVGFSAVLFAMLGMLVKKRKAIVVNIFIIAMPMLLPFKIAWLLHLCCFGVGLGVGFGLRFIKKLDYDYREVVARR